MGLLRRRPLLRAAAVGGGAYVMGKRRAEAEAAAERSYGPGWSPQPGGVTPRGVTPEDTTRLAELGRLHEQGVLTDEEFAQQKARILEMA